MWRRAAHHWDGLPDWGEEPQSPERSRSIPPGDRRRRAANLRAPAVRRESHPDLLQGFILVDIHVVLGFAANGLKIHLYFGISILKVRRCGRFQHIRTQWLWQVIHDPVAAAALAVCVVPAFAALRTPTSPATAQVRLVAVVWQIWQRHG